MLNTYNSELVVVDEGEVFFICEEAHLPIEVVQLVSNSPLENSVLCDVLACCICSFQSHS